MRMQKPWVRTALTALGVAGTVLVAADSDARPPHYVDGSLFSVSLETPDGGPLRVYWHRGERFVLGEPGERYIIRVTNESSERVEAVVSVDGRDAVSGNPGNYVRQRGYLVPAHGSVVLDGFRQSMDQVAAFRFTDPSDSYAARTGAPENIGVVGVAIFTERPRPVVMRRRWRPPPPIVERRGDDRADASGGAPRPKRDSAPADAGRKAAPKPAPSTGEARSTSRGYEYDYDYEDDYRNHDRWSGPRNNLGTRYGESTYSPVGTTRFVRESATSPASVLRMRYDDADGLIARGIRLWPIAPDPVVYDDPEPFPDTRFAQPPP
jgi:hypothetical protein